jgi:hypothetical protein
VQYYVDDQQEQHQGTAHSKKVGRKPLRTRLRKLGMDSSTAETDSCREMRR